VEIHLPPLRERRDDILLLAEHFRRRCAHRYDKVPAGFDSDAVKTLLDHPWPGNVRELAHVIERAVVMAQGETITPSDLALGAGARPQLRLEELTLEEVERVLIQKALSRYEYNISQAAGALGLSRTALYRRLEKYGLSSSGSNG
jgi:DNA-binding NtrC family response regulator